MTKINNDNICQYLLLVIARLQPEDTIMNISLTPQLEGYVKKKVSTGLYHSASEVIREGLRLLEERDSLKDAKLQALRDDIHAGAKSLNDGKGRPFDTAAIKAKGRASR